MSAWLAKSEPTTYSIADLERDGTTRWDGVRNFQARNFLRAMKKGDRVLFYHSSAEPTGVAGLAEVAREAYADPTQFDPKDDHYDAKSSKDDPLWSAVDLRHVRTFPRVVSIDELRATKGLEKLIILRRGNRLSVTPVTKDELERIVALVEKKKK
jgi:predicted RNA-binding protein with PUA-like domain